MPALSLTQTPAARQIGLVMTRTDHELMVYNTDTNELHHLNLLATAVWSRLDGSQTVGELATAVSAELGDDVSPEAVAESLRLLSNAGLLASSWATERQGSRRAFLRRAAVTGAIAVPAVMSITAPSAMAATSGPSAICFNCTAPNQCNKKEYNCGKGQKSCKDVNGRTVGSNGSLEVGTCQG